MPISNTSVSSIQFWVNTGSRNESSENNGISHFLEHLLFKGSKKYPSARQISELIEGQGGYLNAGTSYDVTYYHATLPGEHVMTALDVLADLTLNPTFTPADVETERRVVIEELRRSLDRPTTIFYENHQKHIFKDHPYGRTILGPLKNLKTMSHADLMNYFNAYYRPNNLTLVIAGDFNRAEVLNFIKNHPLTKTKFPKPQFSDIAFPNTDSQKSKARPGLC